MSDSDRAVGVSPPAGVMPNFENPQDAGRTSNLVGNIVCDAILVVVFFLRCYSKCISSRKILLEDAACAIAWVLCMSYSAVTYVMIYYGEGRHVWELSPENTEQISKWLYASSVIYCPAAWFTKVSLLLLIARVFSVRESVARAIHLFLAVLLVGYYVPIEIMKVCICLPIEAYWNTAIQGARCLPQRSIFISDTVLAIISDLIILLIPIPLTWGLNMPLHRKIKIVLLLSAGGVATAVTVYRLYLVIQFRYSIDVTADFVPLSLTTYIEITIGLICTCIPSINAIIERHWPRRPQSYTQRLRDSASSLRKGRRSQQNAGGWFTNLEHRMGLGAEATTNMQTVDTRFNSTIVRATVIRETDVENDAPTRSEQLDPENGEGSRKGGMGECRLGELEAITSVNGQAEGWLAKEDAKGGPKLGAIIEEALASSRPDSTGMWEYIWDGSNPGSVYSYCYAGESRRSSSAPRES